KYTPRRTRRNQPRSTNDFSFAAVLLLSKASVFEAVVEVITPALLVRASFAMSARSDTDMIFPIQPYGCSLYVDNPRYLSLLRTNYSPPGINPPSPTHQALCGLAWNSMDGLKSAI